MSTFALRLPDSLYAHAKKLAERDQASLNQFITVAVAEKVSALDTAAFFSERAAHGWEGVIGFCLARNARRAGEDFQDQLYRSPSTATGGGIGNQSHRGPSDL